MLHKDAVSLFGDAAQAGVTGVLELPGEGRCEFPVGGLPSEMSSFWICTLEAQTPGDMLQSLADDSS